MISRRLFAIAALLISFSLTSCGTRAKAVTSATTAYDNMLYESRYNAPLTDNPPYVRSMIADLISYGEKFLGRRYGSIGPEGRRLDCSGYVSMLFSKFGIDIPRSSKGLSAYVSRIEVPQPGDLLFFTGSNARSGSVGHVALVVSNNKGDIVMMHSTFRGIIKEHLNKSAYFMRRYLHAGRVKEIKKMRLTAEEPSSMAPLTAPEIFGADLNPALSILWHSF